MPLTRAIAAESCHNIAPAAISAVSEPTHRAEGFREEDRQTRPWFKRREDLVEAHGGTIETESAGRDKSATFRIRLPAADTPAERMNREAAASPKSSG
jgi:hypothetical protein